MSRVLRAVSAALVVVATSAWSSLARADDEPAAPPPAPPSKPASVVGLRLDGGWAGRELVGLPVTGGSAGVAFGVQPRSMAAIWGATRIFVGGTESRLAVRSARIGIDGELVLDRVRLGLDLHVFVVGVERVTRDVWIVSWGPGVAGTGRIDLVQASDFALFARAAIEASFEVNGSVFWGPTLGGGLDFDIAGKRAR